MNQQKARKNQIMKELGKQKKQLENDKLSLEEEQSILAAQKSAIEKAIKLEKDRIAEQERLAKQRQRQRQQQQSQHSYSGGGSSSGTPPVSSGSFMRPAQGYISSEFGNRSFDADGFHSGIDIAKGGYCSNCRSR